MTLSRRIVAEGLGTAFLLAAVVGSGIMGERLAGGNTAIALACQYTGHGRDVDNPDFHFRANLRRALQPGGRPCGEWRLIKPSLPDSCSHLGVRAVADSSPENTSTQSFQKRLTLSYPSGKPTIAPLSRQSASRTSSRRASSEGSGQVMIPLRSAA